MSYIVLSDCHYDQRKNSYYYEDAFINDIFLKDNCLHINTKLIKEDILKNYNFNPIKIESKKEQNDKFSARTSKKKETFDNIDNKNINDINLYNSLVNRNPVGLRNWEGICYLNAALQCFYHCKPLTKYFLVDLDNKQKENLGPISKGYYKLVKGLGSGNILAANELKKAIRKIDSIFIGTEGKDSKDVVKLLLSELHEELLELLEKEDSMVDIKKNVNEFNLNEVYNYFLKNNKDETIIKKIFSFSIKNEKQCNENCQKYKKSFYNIEYDFSLMFNLRKVYEDTYDQTYQGIPEISLEDCLHHYKEQEIIECAYCKANTLQVKNSICFLPKIFIFILSRGYKNEFKCKINFREELDMNEFYEPINQNKRDPNTKYKLICATFAYDWIKKGTGHTVAFCRSFKQNKKDPKLPYYYLFNDSASILSDIKEIEDKVPYLLFYEKQE